MPNCFCLYRVSDTERKPVPLSLIDDEICRHFGVVSDKIRYHAAWYDIIGFELAMGKSFSQIREGFEKEVETSQYADEYRHLIEICDYLSSNFTPGAWAEIGRR
jgi:hypothetical protein